MDNLTIDQIPHNQNNDSNNWLAVLFSIIFLAFGGLFFVLIYAKPKLDRISRRVAIFLHQTRFFVSAIATVAVVAIGMAALDNARIWAG